MIINEYNLSKLSTLCANVFTTGIPLTVVVGTADGIRVENISSTAEVKEGDVVLMNDSRVGSHLVIGYLVSISDNPSSTSKSGYVSPIVDYDSLLTVFVKI